MMAREDRTLQMEENFMSLHEAGKSVKEIAQKYGLAYSTVYRALPRIAKAAGVSRESLLSRTRSAEPDAKAELDAVIDEATAIIDESRQRAKQEAVTRVERITTVEAEGRIEPVVRNATKAFHEDYLHALEIIRNFKALVQATLKNAAIYNTEGEK